MKITSPLLAAAAFGLLLNTAASAATWTGKASKNDFSNRKNWSDNKAPTEPKGVYEIDNGDTVELTGTTDFGRLQIGGGSVLNIRGGTHTHGLTGRRTRDLCFRGSGGTINHYDGLYDIGHVLAIGSGGADQGGTYHLMGGQLRIFRGSTSFFGENQTGLATVSLEVGDELEGSTALLDITGASELTTRVGVSIGPNGVFSVTGAKAKIEIGRLKKLDGGWSQQAGGTLRLRIDAGGVTPVLIADADGTPGVAIKFQPGSLLDLGFAEGSEPRAGSWVVFEAENTPFDAATVSGLSLSPSVTDSAWSFSAETRGGHGVIVATYAPLVEPE